MVFGQNVTNSDLMKVGDYIHGSISSHWLIGMNTSTLNPMTLARLHPRLHISFESALFLGEMLVTHNGPTHAHS